MGTERRLVKGRPQPRPRRRNKVADTDADALPSFLLQKYVLDKTEASLRRMSGRYRKDPKKEMARRKNWYETVTRELLLLEPTRTFMKWLAKAQEEEHWTLGELREAITPFLVPEMDTEVGWKNWLKKNYQRIWEFELIGWSPYRSLWPEDRSYENFRRFYKVRHFDSIIDMCKERIYKDTWWGHFFGFGEDPEKPSERVN